MKTLIFNRTLSIALLAGILTAGCNKKEDEIQEVMESIQSAEDNAMIETEFSAVFDAVGDVAELSEPGKDTKETGNSQYTVLPGGATVVFTDSLWTDGDGVEFYVDYGPLGDEPPKGLLCRDGRYRAGRIDASLSEPFFEINSVLTITIPTENEYYVGNGADMARITGVKTVTRTDTLTRHIIVTNASATGQNGTIQWNADRYTTRTMDPTPGLWGDTFTTRGNANGINVNNVSFTAEVTAEDPLVKKLQLGCASTFVSGVVTIENENGGTLALDYDPYDDQACDKVARVTINGNSRIIVVR